MRTLNTEDKEQLELLRTRSMEAATILRDAGRADLADNLVLNVGYAIGLALALAPHFVRMKPLKTLVRQKLITLDHVSDDGEYIRFTTPDNVGHGMWNPGDEKLLVVDCQEIHKNMVKFYPQLFEEVKTDEPANPNG